MQRQSFVFFKKIYNEHQKEHLRKFTMSIKKNNEDSIADGDVEILNTDVVTG